MLSQFMTTKIRPSGEKCLFDEVDNFLCLIFGENGARIEIFDSTIYHLLITTSN